MYILAGVFEMIDSFWSGMGMGIFIVSAIRLVQTVRYKNDDEYAKKLTVQYSDERNLYLSNKARSQTFYYSSLIEAVAIAVFIKMEMTLIAQVLGMVLCGQLIVYFVIYFYLKFKY